MGINMRSEVIQLSGRCVMQAWQAGLVVRLMQEYGVNLSEAKNMAARMRGLMHVSRVHNLVVTGGKQLVCDLLTGSESAGFAYFAIGSGTTTPALTDSALTSEVARKAYTSLTRAGTAVDLAVFFTAAECSYDIHEAGIFGGSAASIAAGSGRIFSHFLQNYDNSSGEVDLTFDYSVTIG